MKLINSGWANLHKQRCLFVSVEYSFFKKWIFNVNYRLLPIRSFFLYQIFLIHEWGYNLKFFLKTCRVICFFFWVEFTFLKYYHYV